MDYGEQSRGARFIEQSHADDYVKHAGATFNDREVAVDGLSWEARKAELKRALGETMNESAAQRKAQRGLGPSRHVAVCLDDRGAFTEDFKDELQRITEEEMQILEAKGFQRPVADLFGVLRSRCQTCGDVCPGYLPQGTVCASASSNLDFPTFCQNCGCPGYFHQIVKSKSSLPASLAESIKSYNIRQTDINFNAAFMTFEIKAQGTASRNVHSLVTLLRGEGLEVLSLETRVLDIQEAMYLRARQLQTQENGITTLASAGFDKDHARRATEIRGAGCGPNIFSQAARNDLPALDKAARDLEQSISRKATRLLQGKGGGKISDGKENFNESNWDGLTFGNSQSNWHNQPIDMEDDLSFGPDDLSQATICPREQENRWKVNNMASVRSKSSKSRQARQRDPPGVNQLMAAVNRSPEIGKMLINPYVIIVVSSVIHQNLGSKIKDQLLPSYFEMVNPKEIALTHLSQTRIQAMEDSVMFAPQLYKLQKSIILTEPAQGLFGNNRGPGQLKQHRTNQAGKKVQSKRELEDSEVGARLAALRGEDPRSDNLDSTVKENDINASGTSKRQRGLTRTLTDAIRRKTLKMQGKMNDESDCEDYDMENNETQKSRAMSRYRKKVEREALQSSSNVNYDPEGRKMEFNYGTMRDFFDYSGVMVQDGVIRADLFRPKLYGYKLLPPLEASEAYQSLVKKVGDSFKRCNMFSIAKVGSPNMILPSTLDVQFRNLQDIDNYIQISDHFFPENSRSQLSVVIIRPVIVINGLNDIFVEILKANDFLIIKRKVRNLTKAEVAYLCEVEKVHKDNMALYIDQVMDGPSEIVVVSKLGAVQDARTICHGSQSGRRRANQAGESNSGTRSNVDSLSAMFEIAPFSSFNEFIDLEDFLVEHSRLFKYKKGSQGKAASSTLRTIDALCVQKIDEIRLELNHFQREFSMAAVAAPSEAEGLKMMRILTPRLAQLEELVLVFNPLYAEKEIEAEELLVRMQYRFVNKTKIIMDRDTARNLLVDKYCPESAEGSQLIDNFTGQEVNFYHLSKVAANKEIRALFAQTDAIFEDHLRGNRGILDECCFLGPKRLPYMFLYMDSEEMFERSLELCYGKTQTTFTGRDFCNTEVQTRLGLQPAIAKAPKLANHSIQSIIETALFTSAGDSILKVVYDANGDLVPRDKLMERNPIRQTAVSGHFRREGQRMVDKEHYLQQRFIVGDADWSEAAQVLPMLSKVRDDTSVRFVVEGESHCLFEVRFHRINHRGDISISSFEDVEFGEEADMNTQNSEKRVRFHHTALRGDPVAEDVKKEAKHFFEKFQSLNFYYQQVNQQYGGGITPSFYRFKLAPMDGTTLNRVYEVEEHMGKLLLEGLAQMQDAHVKQLGRAKLTSNSDWQASLQAPDDQRSLPAFIIGSKIAKICQKLEKIDCSDQSVLKGAGDLEYSQKDQVLRGRILDVNQYFKEDREKYYRMLRDMSSRWHLYISILESEIIETKLRCIIDSLTFKYTRQPELLSLIPDRMTEINLRLASTVKIANPTNTASTNTGANSSSIIDNDSKFYKHVYGDPDRAVDLEKHCGSVMYVTSSKGQFRFQKNKKEQEQRSDQDSSKNRLWDLPGQKDHFGKRLYGDGPSINKLLEQDSFYSETYKDLYVEAKKEKIPFSAGLDSLDHIKEQLEHKKKKQEKYSIHKHVAFSGVEVAKRPRYQLIASLLYLLDFDLRKINRRSDLLGASGIGARAAEAEEEYDRLLDAILKGISEHYGDDAINDVLDLVQLRRGHDTVFEAVLREKTERREKYRLLKNQALEDARRKKRNDLHTTTQELIEQEVRRPARKEESHQFRELEAFLAARSTNKQFSGQDTDEFQQLLARTKTKLGKNTVKLAEEFVLRAQLDQERRAQGKSSIQEKISFVKMEYFLYAFSEAYRVMQQLVKYTAVIRTKENDIRSAHQLKEELEGRWQRTAGDLSRGSNSYLAQARQECQAEIQEINERIQRYHSQIDDTRFTIATKETELLMILRELMAFDIFAPEHHFDGDRIVRRKKTGGPNEVSEYLVPLGTFWRPVTMGEHIVDPQSEEAKYWADYDTGPKPERAGDFLAPALKKHTQPDEYHGGGPNASRSAGYPGDQDDSGHRSRRQDRWDEPRSERKGEWPPQGVEGINRLRKVVPEKRPANLAFEKYKNPSFAREAAHMEKITKTLHARAEPERDRRKFGYEDPFQHLRNKERADDLITECIEHYFSRAGATFEQPGLDEQQCEDLAKKTLDKLRANNVVCDDFNELNFKTTFSIYVDQNLQEVARSQLKNFVKSVAEV